LDQFVVELKDPATESLKRLARKYPHLEEDLQGVLEKLEINPRLGDRIPGCGEHECYKIRAASSDIRKGKRGGFRVITRVVEEMRRVEVWAIYAKPEREDMRPEEIIRLITK